MKTPKLHEDREAAERQWRAAHTIIWCKEQENSNLRKKITELEKELKLVDKNEIDALYSENERLTNLLED